MSNASSIHPSAVIASGATIGPGCEIGPFCVINDQVTLGGGVKLHAHVVLTGKLTLGDGVEIFPFASIGQKTQDLKYQGGIGTVTIGPRTVLREYVTVHQPTHPDGLTSIGSDCNLLAYCHIAHDCRIGNHVVMSNVATLAGHVEVGNHVVIGGMSGVHQFCKIGDYAMLGAYSKLVMDILPFCLADGGPAATRMVNKINLERNGFSRDDIQRINRAFKIFFRSNLPAEGALAKLREEFPEDDHVGRFISAIENSDRGVARPAPRKKD